MAHLNQTYFLSKNGFSKNTEPNLFHNPAFGTEYNAAQKAYIPPVKDVYPARDNRYPAYAGPMEDGRLVTDYRPHCTKNIRSGLQFNTKVWLINHTNDIIDESRRRQVEWTGASLQMANTVPPPANIVYSNPFYSEVNKTQLQNGIGVERANVACPPLFGTFTYEPTMAEIQNNRKNIGLTQFYEGGRNSPRGNFAT
jgi:hypothetical protein